MGDETEIDVMTRRLQAAILPVVKGQQVEVVMPAIIQVAISLAMYWRQNGPLDAVESIIATLEDARRLGVN